MSKYEIQGLLAELDRMLPGADAGESATLTESALRGACSAAALAAYPDASGAEHEMDVRRLLGAVVEAYATGERHRAVAGHRGEAVFAAAGLRNAVHRLRA